MTGLTANRLIDKCKANFPLHSNIDTKKTCALWIDQFRNTPDDLMETAINLCLLSCKSFPTIADVRKAIDDLRADLRTQASGKYLNPRSRYNSPAAQKAFEVVKNGAASGFLDSINIDDIREFAQSKIPDISDELIRRNYSDIVTAQESWQMCFSCKWAPPQCTAGGFCYDVHMGKNGRTKLSMTMCRKKMTG